MYLSSTRVSVVLHRRLSVGVSGLVTHARKTEGGCDQKPPTHSISSAAGLQVCLCLHYSNTFISYW